MPSATGGSNGPSNDPFSANYNPQAYFQAMEAGKEHELNTRVIVAEDNEAVIEIIAKGRSPKLRHLPKIKHGERGS